MAITAKLNKTINYGARIIIATAALWFIYRQLNDAHNLESFISSLKYRVDKKEFLIPAVISLILMPLNWGLEAVKWRMLISYVERVSFMNAVLSVFTGITMSLFTPNRIGEFFARLLTLKKAPVMKGAFLTITGSLSQLMTTLLFGMLSLCIFIPQYIPVHTTGRYLAWLLVCFFCLISAIVMVSLYFRVSSVSRVGRSFVKPGWIKIRGYLRVMRRLKRRLLLKVLLLSMARYAVFSTQFFLLLIAFGVEINWYNAFILISMTYFVMTAIPTIALADLGIRGSVSVFFIGLYGSAPSAVNIDILAASTAVWMVNLALPALIGLLFIYRLNLIRKQ